MNTITERHLPDPASDKPFELFWRLQLENREADQVVPRSRSEEGNLEAEVVRRSCGGVSAVLQNP